MRQKRMQLHINRDKYRKQLIDIYAIVKQQLLIAEQIECISGCISINIYTLLVYIRQSTDSYLLINYRQLCDSRRQTYRLVVLKVAVCRSFLAKAIIANALRLCTHSGYANSEQKQTEDEMPHDWSRRSTSLLLFCFLQQLLLLQLCFCR